MQLPPVVLIRDWLFVSPLNGAVGLNRPSGWECWLCLDWESNGWALLWSWLVLTPELRLLMRALTLQGVSKWLYAWMPHQHRNCKYLWLRANIIRYTVSIEYKYYVFTLLWITALGIVFWKNIGCFWRVVQKYWKYSLKIFEWNWELGTALSTVWDKSLYSNYENNITQLKNTLYKGAFRYIFCYVDLTVITL